MRGPFSGILRVGKGISEGAHLRSYPGLLASPYQCLYCMLVTFSSQIHSWSGTLPFELMWNNILMCRN
jgi:hypothetical protein